VSRGLESSGQAEYRLTRLVVRNPANDEVVTDIGISTEADVVGAVRRSRAAAADWAATAPGVRAGRLRAAADLLESHRDELAALVTTEMGKPLADARGGVDAGISTLHQYAELGPLHRGRSLAGDRDATDLMVHEPRGVVAVITPWNDPVAVSCGLLGAALVTGNAAVYKPSERTPGTGQLLADLLAEHLPSGVLTTVVGDAKIGALLVEQPVDVVVHVGSSTTGRMIAETCARTGAKAVLENGGKDALIVDGDVDPVWAADQAALGAFANAGQLCVAVERIYAHERVVEPFLEALVERAGQLRVGPGLDAATELGPLVDRRHRDLVHQQVMAAVDEGAHLQCGGSVPAGPGAFYPATVLHEVTDRMAVMAEETFGPVAPVAPVASFEEALQRAASSGYGLAATVLTSSMQHAQEAWRRLPVGTVKINAVFGGAPGGAAHPRRASGSGYGYGPELLDELTATKVVHAVPYPM
jgi:succinate-semialdehyde dehydrogenase/glutarate-semialdehyde dehydrogenase